jgi:carboxypeptidase Taq
MPDLARAAADRPASVDDDLLTAYPPETLLRVATALASHLGFGGEAGRIDACAQPFFMDDNPDDPRIGVRLDTGPVWSTLMGLTHEIGHARHERNGPRAWRGQPVGRSRSAAIQESQALLLEMIVGRSDTFWRTAAPVVAAAIGVKSADLEPARIGALLRRVCSGPLRGTADELTYGLHITLRYQLERDLLERRLPVRELPDAWNAASEALLGATPADAAEGCLQDIHWHRALFGYFPSYAQGQWAAAQFTAAAERDMPDLWEGEGRFDDLAAWLRAQVHERGSQLTTDALMTAATGAPLSPDAFLAHARKRYGRDAST